jgi:hypothetical protein
MVDYLKNPYLMSVAFSLASVGGLYYDSKQKETQSYYTYRDYLKYFFFSAIVLISFYYLVTNGMITETASLVGGATAAIASTSTVVEKLTEEGFPIQQKIRTGFPAF